MNNTIFTHADDNNKYYQSNTTVVTKEGRLQSSKLFHTKVSIDYTFDFRSRGMTASDFIKIIEVIPHYVKSDNTLKCYDATSRRQKPMSKADLQRILGLKKDGFNKFWQRCTKANVFKFDKWISNNDVTCEAIFINPALMQLNYSITPLAYWLFKSDIDKKLDDTTIAMFTDEYHRQYGYYNHEDANTYLSNEREDKSPTDIFNELVLNNKEADIYNFGDTINTYFLVNESHTPGKRKATDITKYTSLFIDIDAGKDEKGNYYSLEEVAKRKAAMLEVIYSFPLVPTVITDTRNGYHCIWSINAIEDGEKWQAAEDTLVSYFKIADKAVSDKARVLRLPGSTWKKGIYTEYEVSIFDANYVRYDINTFVKELDEAKDDIEQASNTYLSNYPMTIKEVQKHKSIINTAVDNQRIKAISNKEVFYLKDNKKATVYTYSQFKDMVKRVNLATFLGVPEQGLFKCVFHNDTNDSANIVGNKVLGYRYYCFSPECESHGKGYGSDIINCVMMLQGSEYKEAISYLAKVFNVTLINNR